MPYGITQCYLLLTRKLRGDISACTAAKLVLDTATPERFKVDSPSFWLVTHSSTNRQWCIGGYTRVYAVYQPPGFF